jgi:hypothetical protein
MAKQWGEDPDVLHRKAQSAILSALAAGQDDVLALMDAVAPFDVPNRFTPDVALLEIAAAALGLAWPPRSAPLEYQGSTDRYLSDLELSGRTLRHRTHYAIHAAACMRGGLLPDLLGEAGAWQPKLWTYAVSAILLYSRAAADRLELTVPDVARQLAAALELDLAAPQQASE